MRILGGVLRRLLHTVISAGDVVMLVGIATIVAAGMRTTEAAEPATPSDPPFTGSPMPISAGRDASRASTSSTRTSTSKSHSRRISPDRLPASSRARA